MPSQQAAAWAAWQDLGYVKIRGGFCRWSKPVRPALSCRFLKHSFNHSSEWEEVHVRMCLWCVGVCRVLHFCTKACRSSFLARNSNRLKLIGRREG